MALLISLSIHELHPYKHVLGQNPLSKPYNWFQSTQDTFIGTNIITVQGPISELNWNYFLLNSWSLLPLSVSLYWWLKIISLTLTRKQVVTGKKAEWYLPHVWEVFFSAQIRCPPASYNNVIKYHLFHESGCQQWSQLHHIIYGSYKYS